MDVTKPYEFTGFGAMDVTKPYGFIGFGAMDATSTADFRVHGPRLCKVMVIGRPTRAGPAPFIILTATAAGILHLFFGSGQDHRPKRP
jgi:hypothetical protein